MVFVKVATGIGAGIISGGELMRGNHGRAGDIGHIRALRPSDVLCTCGNRGCVAVLASGSAMVRQLGEAGIEVASTADVVALVRAGDAVAMHHVREAGRVLGAALAAVVSVVAPSVIIVGGEMGDASEPLIAGIREGVYQQASTLATRELRILTSRLGHARRRGRRDDAGARARAGAGERRRAARAARARGVILAIQENLVGGETAAERLATAQAAGFDALELRDAARPGLDARARPRADGLPGARRLARRLRRGAARARRSTSCAASSTGSSRSAGTA